MGVEGRAGSRLLHGWETASTKMNVARMDSHGGWVGTPGEMLAFALRVDGFAEPIDLLEAGSSETMAERRGVNEAMPVGGASTRSGNYWHAGSLPGLTSLLVRTAEGLLLGRLCEHAHRGDRWGSRPADVGAVARSGQIVGDLCPGQFFWTSARFRCGSHQTHRPLRQRLPAVHLPDAAAHLAGLVGQGAAFADQRP